MGKDSKVKGITFLFYFISISFSFIGNPNSSALLASMFLLRNFVRDGGCEKYDGYAVQCGHFVAKIN